MRSFRTKIPTGNKVTNCTLFKFFVLSMLNVYIYIYIYIYIYVAKEKYN